MTNLFFKEIDVAIMNTQGLVLFSETLLNLSIARIECENTETLPVLGGATTGSQWQMCLPRSVGRSIWIAFNLSIPVLLHPHGIQVPRGRQTGEGLLHLHLQAWSLAGLLAS